MSHCWFTINPIHNEKELKESSDKIYERLPEEKRPDIYQKFKKVVEKLPYYSDGKKKLRKNGVIIAEFLFTYEQDETDDDFDSLEWKAAVKSWFNNTFPTSWDTILVFQLHTEESSYHIHVLWIPVTVVGKICYMEYFDGRMAINALRSNYSKYLGNRFMIDPVNSFVTLEEYQSLYRKARLKKLKRDTAIFIQYP